MQNPVHRTIEVTQRIRQIYGNKEKFEWKNLENAYDNYDITNITIHDVGIRVFNCKNGTPEIVGIGKGYKQKRLYIGFVNGYPFIHPLAGLHIKPQVENSHFKLTMPIKNIRAVVKI